MVCSSCGFENQADMRFCGMCGTPLPHRPLTTPGAQSTLNLTRLPVEGGLTQDQSSATTSMTQPQVRDTASAGGNSGNGHSPGPAETEAEALPKELVPDVSLDEYVQKFHYEPPSDAAEVTMRGDAAPSIERELLPPPQSAVEVPAAQAPVAKPEPPREIPVKHEPAIVTGPPPHIGKTPTRISVEKKPMPAITPPAPPASSVAERLGLDTPAEERVRPRFLDVNEPAKTGKSAPSSGTSTIVGPSFLGLSDAPMIAAESLPADADEPRPTHWRGWVAVAILLLFAVLGLTQWKAQSGNSPIAVIKTKLAGLMHRSSQPTESEQAAGAPTPTTNSPASSTSPAPSAPETTGTTTPGTTQQSNPPGPAATDSATTQQNSPAATASASPSTSAAVPPGVAPNQSADQKPQTAAQNPQGPPTVDNSASVAPAPAAAKSTATVPSASKVAEQTRKPGNTNEKAAAAKPAPGADEMLRAKNASDSAATAAWLWKATAKGNPDAPVQLADMYVKGTGVPRSCEQAMVLLKTAAEKTNALARNRLASMYQTGNCVQRNRVEAYRWLSAALAANPESQWAQQNRDVLWNQMSPQEQAAAQKYR